MLRLSIQLTLLNCIICFVLSSALAEDNVFTESNAITQTSAKAIEIDAYLQAHADAYGFMGTALVAKGETILFRNAYGFADVENSIPNTLDTTFAIASLTKQFTAAAIMLLQEQGKLNVQDSITEFFPDFPNGDAITIAMLLSHTSGIYDFAEAPYRNFDRLRANYDDVSIANFIHLIGEEPVEFPPGSQFSYNQSGYVLASEIVARASNMPYEVFLENSIFKPLGMTHTGYDFAFYRENTPEKRAKGYRWNGQDYLEGRATEIPFAIGAGGIYSNVSDLYKWYLALENHALETYSLLSRQSFREMTASQVAEGDFAPFDSYGYGWFVRNDFMFSKVYSHSGAASRSGVKGSHYRSLWLRLPDTTLILLQSNVEESAIRQMATDITAILNNRSYSLPTRGVVVEVALGELEPYGGTYEFESGVQVNITLIKNAFHYQLPNQSPRKLLASKHGEFLFEDGSALVFNQNNNVVDSFSLFVSDIEIIAKKMN